MLGSSPRGGRGGGLWVDASGLPEEESPPRCHPLLSCRGELFNAHNGARQDASKILIVITDGEKTGDRRHYWEVIPEAEAKGIIRYAVGVGCGCLPLLPRWALPFQGQKPQLLASTALGT